MPWIGVLGIGVVACRSPGPAGVDLTISYAGDTSLESLLVRTYLAGQPALEPGWLPEEPRALRPEGENAVIVMPGALGGSWIDIRVDGYAGQRLERTGLVTVELEAGAVIAAHMELGPPAACGDALAVQGVEECDDGNRVAGDGCSEHCYMELGWDCNRRPGECLRCTRSVACGGGDCDLECTDGACVCELDCRGATSRCNSTCRDGTDCWVQCGEGNRCRVECTDSSTTCAVQCVDARTCDVECAAGSSCLVRCADAGECEVWCEDGAECLLLCESSQDCSFERCDSEGGAMSCAGNMVVCNRPCPEAPPDGLSEAAARMPA